MTQNRSTPLYALLGLEDEHSGLRVETLFADRTVKGRWVLPTVEGVAEAAMAAHRIQRNVPGATTQLVDETGRVVATPEILAARSRLIIGSALGTWVDSSPGNLTVLDRSLKSAQNWREARIEHQVDMKVGDQTFSVRQLEGPAVDRPALAAKNLLQTLSRPQTPKTRKAAFPRP